MTDLLTAQLAGQEIERYAEELIKIIEPLSSDQLWSKAGNIPNSIGTLTRHLTGNLNHYFGAGIAQNGYIRERDREFSDTDLDKAKLISDLKSAVQVAKQAIAALDAETIYQPYTTPDGVEYDMLADHIVRMTTHFVLHYGQADYAQHCIR